ncbi:unnamed protein product [Caenorhabditis sp. 36 PRJEB53466]|nr:unnamed protein product [Caenorhabditis sp. 36 PRJEB53466]
MSTFSCKSLLLLLVFVPGFLQFRSNFDQYLLDKPIVVPAAEGDYHYVMIEADTIAQGGSRTPSFAKIGVMLLDGMFTFSGVDERWFNRLTQANGRKCHPFYGTNVVHKCEDEYFLLNADFVNIKKVIFKRTDSILDVCKKFHPNSSLTDKNNFMIRFGRRALMAYKKGNNYNKCIGTYDIEDDQFSCMWPQEDGNLKELRISGFLYNEITGNPHRDDNTVEVFCKVMHKFD